MIADKGVCEVSSNEFFTNSIILKSMSATKESITPCLQCGKKYVDHAVDGVLCDSCQQFNQTEIDLAGALHQARLESGGLSISRMAKILHSVLKDDTKSLLKELMKYEI